MRPSELGWAWMGDRDGDGDRDGGGGSNLCFVLISASSRQRQLRANACQRRGGATDCNQNNQMVAAGWDKGRSSLLLYVCLAFPDVLMCLCAYSISMCAGVLMCV